LPEHPDSLFEDGRPVALKFMRFQPPQRLDKNAEGNVVLPHIRFDRALDYLIGDWLK
jgi:predicted YcjX-like family ATPase